MSKKKPRWKDLPPEGLWISPEGDFHEVVEHLIALRDEPELFDLSWLEVSNADVKELRGIAVKMISNGWIRFRYLSGVYFFEVDRAKRRVSMIESILVECAAHESEKVVISQVSHDLEFTGTVADFYDRKIFGYYANPKRNTWRFS